MSKFTNKGIQQLASDETKGLLRPQGRNFCLVEYMVGLKLKGATGRKESQLLLLWLNFLKIVMVVPQTCRTCIADSSVFNLLRIPVICCFLHLSQLK